MLKQQTLHEKLSHLSIHISNAEDANQLIEQFLNVVSLNCLRMYICNSQGMQISSNYTRSEVDQWVKDDSMQQVNWCWRPHFIPNILRMKIKKQGIVSHVYTDIDFSKMVQTFSYPVSENEILFMDMTI